MIEVKVTCVPSDHEKFKGYMAYTTVYLGEHVTIVKFNSDSPLTFRDNVSHAEIFANEDLYIDVQIDAIDTHQRVNRMMDHYKKFLANEKLRDVTLVLEDAKFPAHRDVLSARSPVFISMIKHQESKETRVVKVAYVKPVTFDLLLEYIYHETVDARKMTSPTKDWVDLLAASKKYRTAELVKIREDRVLGTLTAESVWDVFSAAGQADETKDLKNKCVEFVIANSSDVAETNGRQFTVLHLERMRCCLKK